VDAAKLAQRCGELHHQVRELLQKEPVQMRVNVLLASLFGATDGAPYQTWAPYIAIFLGMVMNRDGVCIGVAPIEDEDDGDESESTLH
jgi:hypothetical protein